MLNPKTNLSTTRKTWFTQTAVATKEERMTQLFTKAIPLDIF